MKWTEEECGEVTRGVGTTFGGISDRKSAAAGMAGCDEAGQRMQPL